MSLYKLRKLSREAHSRAENKYKAKELAVTGNRLCVYRNYLNFSYGLFLIFFHSKILLLFITSFTVMYIYCCCRIGFAE